MRDRRNLPEENQTQLSQQNILDNNDIGRDLTVGNINQYQYFLNLAGLSDSQPIPLTINQSSPKHPPLLFDLLLQIDFKKQFRLVKTVIEKHQTIGFLVHGELDCGQQMLTNRLYRVKPTWQNHKPICIDVSSNAGYSNLQKLWGRVGGCLGLKRDAEHSLILEQICDRLKTQDVIFIFSKVELMLLTKTLTPWLEEFWQPLVRMAKTIEPLRKTHLLMFLVDNCGSVCQSEVTLAEEFEPLSYNPFIPLQLPPTSAFTLDMLEDWFDYALGLSQFTMPAGLTPQVLYEKSENGIPQYVVDEICKHCGLSWEGGLAKWLI